MKTRRIAPVVTIKPLRESSTTSSDLEYWLQQTPQARIDALKSIRKEYHSWKYPDGIRFQRVYTIVKQNNVQYLVVGGYAVAFHGFP